MRTHTSPLQQNSSIHTNKQFFFHSCTGLGLCIPEASAFGLPGSKATSWAYHGDGLKFHGDFSLSLKYGFAYRKGDTVGCGINLQTSKLFFTKNGVNLGKKEFCCPQYSPIALKSRSPRSPLQKVTSAKRRRIH